MTDPQPELHDPPVAVHLIHPAPPNRPHNILLAFLDTTTNEYPSAVSLSPEAAMLIVQLLNNKIEEAIANADIRAPDPD